VHRQDFLQLENETVFNEAVIEEREQGIREIHQQIGEVNEIFKDLAVLVHEQGYMIGLCASFCHPYCIPVDERKLGYVGNIAKIVFSFSGYSLFWLAIFSKRLKGSCSFYSVMLATVSLSSSQSGVFENLNKLFLLVQMK
jgi:hypothetical protein